MGGKSNNNNNNNNINNDSNAFTLDFVDGDAAPDDDYDELMKMKGRYFALYQSQFAG